MGWTPDGPAELIQICLDSSRFTSCRIPFDHDTIYFISVNSTVFDKLLKFEVSMSLRMLRKILYYKNTINSNVIYLGFPDKKKFNVVNQLGFKKNNGNLYLYASLCTCLRASLAIVWKAWSTLIASLALVSKYGMLFLLWHHAWARFVVTCSMQWDLWEFYPFLFI